MKCSKWTTSHVKLNQEKSQEAVQEKHKIFEKKQSFMCLNFSGFIPTGFLFVGVCKRQLVYINKPATHQRIKIENPNMYSEFTIEICKKISRQR